jgi:hypothetical protein
MATIRICSKCRVAFDDYGEDVSIPCCGDHVCENCIENDPIVFRIMSAIVAMLITCGIHPK